MLKRFLFFIFCTLVISAYAQDKKSLDSLERALTEAKDTLRVNTLIGLSDAWHQDDPHKAVVYGKEALALAQQLNFSNGLFHSNIAIALALYVGGSNDSALVYFNKATAIAEKNENQEQIATAYINMGNVYGDIGQNKKCIEYYLKGAEITEKLKQSEKSAYIEVNIGTVYSVLGQHDTALVYYEKAEKTLSAKNKDHKNLPIIYNNIGATWLELKDTAKAETAFENAYRISKKYDNRRGLASCYDHLGVLAYFYKHQKDTAIAMVKRSIGLYEETGSKSGVSEASVHLGEIYFKEKNYDEALKILNAGIRVAEELKDYYNLKNYYDVMSEIYEAKGDLGLALDYHKKFMVVKDTMYNLNNSSIVSEMKNQLANEKNAREIEALNARDKEKTIVIYSAAALGLLILLLALLAFNRYLVKKRAGEKLSEQNEEIQLQKNIIEEKNKDITDSIKYAQRIQNAILPSQELIHSYFPDSFVFFRPKAIVSGDFYWFEQSGDYKFFSVVDCTGHGVPGAMLSVVGHNFLNKAVNDEKLVMPDKLLQFLNENISKMLRQKHEDLVIQDGMDIALCAYNEKTKMLYYSGSFNSLYHVRNGKLNEIRSDKIFIGNFYKEPDKFFTLHSINVESGDLFYVFSDGFADQFGGPAGKKFKYKPFQQLLLSICNEPMVSQEQKLSTVFEKWRNELDQVDDVCVIGVRV